MIPFMSIRDVRFSKAELSLPRVGIYETAWSHAPLQVREETETLSMLHGVSYDGESRYCLQIKFK